MTDIDALIERLKNTSADLFYATPCTAKLMCEQAADALERMRDDSTALRARLAEWEAKWRDEYVNAEVMRERLAEVEGALRDILAIPNSEAAQGIMKVIAKAALASAGEAQDDE